MFGYLQTMTSFQTQKNNQINFDIQLYKVTDRDITKLHYAPIVSPCRTTLTDTMDSLMPNEFSPLGTPQVFSRQDT